MAMKWELLLDRAQSQWHKRKPGPVAKATVLSGAAAGVYLGTCGWLLGALLGCMLGFAVGLLLAFLTFGLSIPFFSVIGTLVGAYVGAYQGVGSGLLLGGLAGYHISRTRYMRELTHLLEHSKYGRSNCLTKVMCKEDVSTKFCEQLGSANNVGQHIVPYLDEAVNLYRLLNDNKIGVPIRDRQSIASDDEYENRIFAAFSEIIGNYERRSNNSGWMFVSREQACSPVGQRELWLVVRGSTTALDWFHDIEAVRAPVDVGLDTVGVCEGFYKKAASIIQDMQSKGALEAIRKAACDSPFQRIFIVGHSLAGAVATQIQSFTAVPFLSAGVKWDRTVVDKFGHLQEIWAAALGEQVFDRLTVGNVSDHFLTFALEPASAFKSKGTPKTWEEDAYSFQTETSYLKEVLERTLILTIYGGDPVPRLNIEVGGLVLPPMKLGLFYSSPDAIKMQSKYQVDSDALYLLHGPPADNRITRFAVWSDLHTISTLNGRVQHIVNFFRDLKAGSPTGALQLALGDFGMDHVLMFKPGYFVAGLRNLPQTTLSGKGTEAAAGLPTST